MGCFFFSGSWFKSIIRPRKAKKDRSKKVKVHSATEKANGSKQSSPAHGDPSNLTNSDLESNQAVPGILPAEYIAAFRIQKAFRAYKARKTTHRLKGAVRFNVLIHGHDSQKQASSTLAHIHSWSSIQAQIRARRHHMVTEGRIKQKKLENQLKLEARLQEIEIHAQIEINGTKSSLLPISHMFASPKAMFPKEGFNGVLQLGILCGKWLHARTSKLLYEFKIRCPTPLSFFYFVGKVEWCGGSDTMEEILSRIQQREEAAVKRERAMAYAFSHQWRANPTQYLGQAYYSLGKENWGWSWKERWVAARPWEIRVHADPHNLKKAHPKQESKPEIKVTLSTKPALSNGKVSAKPKKLPSPAVDYQDASSTAGSSHLLIPS